MNSMVTGCIFKATFVRVDMVERKKSPKMHINFRIGLRVSSGSGVLGHLW